ncbi:MAG: hypothetical protein A3E07_02740 [Candidatus Wildermuthbacteria bacterium RIFCSPHIGHO2_12_FULL_45_9]|uniref:Uncharacterized protein n=1 Tax=Candidatus Wildermuthbacteria bacterium RIFCSPHIGHO2_02_FULL_45_25 TaxID=1802450 RepID=A0A1G2R4Y5_9BACT|nr:MAG: hypothetical protein A2748_02475 [Candidatus Wildermuthbacteria bacterium RIFCSPHIGHO2_01_FULL_45_20]OHA67141.1 MAG: hypothetical protein A3C04_02550 [Candidatus Wildermuthbacteria bacterium RIFCSPHIGHO2_02_FULL_45_25]OHA71427.1 MAG: hypothetical protein A3E07_02740 [Candidatus Wildermuthbacteria bacterium RIFCSPHIGHO2_12_FULL_45_9]
MASAKGEESSSKERMDSLFSIPEGLFTALEIGAVLFFWGILFLPGISDFFKRRKARKAKSAHQGQGTLQEGAVV